jgi:hypothetical protein
MRKPFTEKQMKSFNRSVDRAIARQDGADIKLPLFIRISESRLYNGKPVYKALLKEVVFLRMQNLRENDLRIPKGTPWSYDYTKYEGWCYAKQEYLANRVGCEYTYANKALKQIAKDGFLKPRKYRGRDGRWHKQYFPVEEAIDRAILEVGTYRDVTDEESDDKSADKSVATPEPIVLKASDTSHKDNSPVDIKTSAHLSLSQNPLAIKTTKEVSEFVSKLGDFRESTSTAPSASPSGDVVVATLLQEQEQKQNQPQPLCGLVAKQEQKQPQPLSGQLLESYRAHSGGGRTPHKGLVARQGEKQPGLQPVGKGFDVTEPEKTKDKSNPGF